MQSSKYHLSAEEVRRIRRSLGETQAEFAKRLCVDAVTVARWETDQRKCTGLYAKTIAELDPKYSLLIKERAEMEGKQELIRTTELHQLYSLIHDLKPILRFLYKEIPLEHRKEILETYQTFFEKWYFDEFFKGICNSKLLKGISSFCIVIIPVVDNFWDSNRSTKYQDEKLSISYKAIYEAAKELAPRSNTANPEDSFPIGDIGMMFIYINSALEDLYNQSNLKEGDKAILKLFRNLVEFTCEERNKRKYLPIPDALSFSFARFLSVCLDQPTRILVPQFDDRSQRESLREYLERT